MVLHAPGDTADSHPGGVVDGWRTVVSAADSFSPSSLRSSLRLRRGRPAGNDPVARVGTSPGVLGFRRGGVSSWLDTGSGRAAAWVDTS